MSLRIAIVGLGGVFPGARDLEDFWRIIRDGHDQAREVPAERWGQDPRALFATEKAQKDQVYSTRACLVDEFELDLSGIALRPDEVAELDPMFHFALHAARDAYVSAQLESVARERIGVIFGNIALPTDTSSALASEIVGRVFAEQHAVAGAQSDTAPMNRYVAGYPAGVVARALALGGPALTLDAACASSLYALKLACDELTSGRADAMLAGGVSRPSCLYTQMGFSQLRALSQSGRCSPFDHKGDGLVVGEGAGIFMLKRLEDAVEHGDTIHGVLQGIGLANDIGGSLLAPDSEGQVRALYAAYQEAGWNPDDVDLVECHATGTPVGDAKEIASLRELWRNHDWQPAQCVVGGVKSNFGHLLTAAGAAGLMKVLFALRHDTLPPTANFEAPAEGVDLADGPFRVTCEAELWPRRQQGTPRRAAINAFGFGGIDAHVLIEEWLPAQTPSTTRDAISSEPIAIVGLAARVGPWENLEALDNVWWNEKAPQPSQPTHWWGCEKKLSGEPIRGHFCTDLEVPLGRYRIPPRELEELLPQQLLMLDVAVDAAQAAGWSDEELHLRAGVFIGIALDLNTTNFQLRWSLPESLRDLCMPPLTANRTMGALGGIVASRVARELRVGGPSHTISSEDTSGLHALSAAMEALRRGELDSALVGAVDLAGDVRSVLASRRAGFGAPVPADGAGAMILKRLDDAQRDGDTIHAVLRSVDVRGGGEQQTALSETTSRVGHCGAAAGFMDLIHQVRGLELAIDPNTPGRSDYWLRNRDQGPRSATVRAHSVGGDAVRVTVEEFESSLPNAVVDPHDETLFVVRGSDQTALFESLTQLRDHAREFRGSVSECARVWYQNSCKDGQSLVIVADAESLADSISAAQALIAHDTPLPASQSNRVFFSDKPLAATGAQIAFVYPGSGNHYPRMGADFARRYPAVAETQDRNNRRLRSQLRADTFWEDHEPTVLDCILGQVSVGSLITDVLGQHGVRPERVLGYSLGESASYVALGVWPQRDTMLTRVEESPIFSTQLAGSFEAVRRAWQTTETINWSIAVVDCPEPRVRAAVQDHPWVDLLIVNTAAECVIGGDARQLDAVARKLGVHLHTIDGVMAVHSDVLRPVADAYLDLHRQTTTPPPGIQFYSAVTAEPLQLDSESAAHSITAQGLHGFDFTKLVERAYEDGARVFIEVGPGASCTRMIRSILKDRLHMARSASDPRRGELRSLIRVLAALIAEGFAVDLAAWFPEQPAAIAPASKTVRVPVGGPAFESPQPPEKPATPKPVPSMRINKTSEPLQKQATPMPNPDPVLESTFAQGSAQLDAASRAHARFLELSARTQEQMAHAISVQMDLVEKLAGQVTIVPSDRGTQPHTRAHDNAITQVQPPVATSPKSTPTTPPVAVPKQLDRDQCMEFAIGRIVNVLGTQFAGIDDHPTRVRLPDEPLMLVDRILEIDAEPLSMTGGRIVTEHDVGARPWYLDGGVIPTCIAVEAGQADLFLSGYLGIDRETRGHAVYRLLDAEVTFHDHLPEAGKVITYDIHIDEFFRQGETILFRFRFEATVDGRPLLTMKNGCAGFFTEQELAAGQGIVKTRMALEPRPGVLPADWAPLAPFENIESYDDRQLEALRKGDLNGCFGEAFEGLPLTQPKTLPQAPMNLVHRILELDPKGGRFGLGVIRGEADIHPDDWFLTCHFCDDMVMPGTLMYECCLHTLRVFLLRMGWVGEEGQVRYEPIPGQNSRLKCRGQVLSSTKKVVYEIVIQELGYSPEPYAIVEALMYADGKPIVDIGDMSVRLTGLDREQVERLWKHATPPSDVTRRAPLYDTDRILSFAIGKPSEAFGAPYQVFDDERVIARLPGPPYQFLDRIVSIENAQPFVLEAGGTIEAEYDVPVDAWYFSSNRQPNMPFAVLLEVALQPCGWFAAFVGSALAESVDLSFRNLGGQAVLHRPVTASSGTLTTRVDFTRVSHSGGMLIQNFNLEVRDKKGVVYSGDTYFGFFSKEALANQVGMPQEDIWSPASGSPGGFPVPVEAPFPDDQMRMITQVEYLLPDGGPHGLGAVRGSTTVDPSAWFFKAHFYQDPVWPGSLGLESFLQLLQVFATQRWGSTASTCFTCTAPGTKHQWTYRGQILPSDKRVVVDVVVTAIDDHAQTVTANGYLTVDGRIIYKMEDFTVLVS